MMGNVTGKAVEKEPTAGRAAAGSEIAEYLGMSRQRRRIFPRAALVGMLAGGIALIFRTLLAGGDWLRISLIEWARQAPAIGWIVPLLFGAIGAAGSVWLVRQYAPEASGSGIPHIEAVLHRLRDLNWRRVLPVKLIGGTLALGSGMALGREGPTVQMGGAIGAAVATWLNSPVRERMILIASGAGAGLAAAFNAPLAGLVFVLEEVQRDFRPLVFGAAFIAAAVADILARFIGGQSPVFSVPSYVIPPLSTLPTFAVLGLIAGLLGVMFNRSLLLALKLSGRLNGRNALIAAALVGAGAGLVAWFTPVASGSGHDLTETALIGEVALSAIPFWFLLRFVLTIASYGSGAPGGIFAPLLVLGSLVGLAVGKVAYLMAPLAAPEPAVFAVVGMAAMFTAIVRAPLTGIVLILEMTGNYNQMLPLLVSCFCAYVAAEFLNDLPIYEALLARDLSRTGASHVLEEPAVLELDVEPQSLFVGRRINQLGLPAGMLIVRVRDGSREWVPTAVTYLEPHMKITVVIAPEAAHGIEMLREGCARPHHA